MAKTFREIATDARDAWSDDVRQMADAAADVFTSEMDARAALGAEFASLRKARQLTQPELQRLSGVQQAEISRIEGGVANPTLATVEKLAEALGARLTVADGALRP